MEITIGIRGRSPTPRVINVKQYSSKVDVVTFALGEVFSNKAVCAVVGEEYRQSIELKGGKAVWEIAGAFTQKRGSFNIQLEVTDDETVWKSDVMLLIVSESTGGSRSTESGGYGVAGDSITISDGFVDEGVAGTYEDFAINKEIVSGMPYSDGIIQYYDLTGYNGETEVMNALLDKGWLPDGADSGLLSITGGIADENAMLTNNTSSSYGSFNTSAVKGNMAMYTVCQGGILFSSGVANSTGQRCALHYVNSKLYLDGCNVASGYDIDVSVYNVICLNSTSAGMELYCNGEYMGILTTYNLSTEWFIGKVATISAWGGIPLYTRCISIFDKAQSAEQIQENSNWFYNKFVTEVV